MTLIVSEIAIFNAADGALAVLGPTGTPLRPGQASVALPAGYSPETFDWNAATRTMIENASKVEATLLPLVDTQRETFQMTVLTPGGAKKYVYNRKAAEAIAASGIVATVLNALTLVDKKRKYPFAYAESALTGDTLSTVLARFEAGMNTSAIENARIEAVAQKAKRDIKAATTVAAKRAAYPRARNRLALMCARAPNCAARPTRRRSKPSPSLSSRAVRCRRRR